MRDRVKFKGTAAKWPVQKQTNALIKSFLWAAFYIRDVKCSWHCVNFCSANCLVPLHYFVNCEDLMGNDIIAIAQRHMTLASREEIVACN